MPFGPKSSGPPRRPNRPQRDPQLERKVAQLMSSHGLDKQLATAIATGKEELNEVLKRMVQAAEVENLIRKHGITRALATQIVLKQAELGAVLFKMRLDAHVSEHRDRSALDEAARTKKPVALSLMGNRNIEGVVLASERYELVFQEAGKPEERIHKLKVKLLCDADERKRLRRAVRFDNEIKARPREPAVKPQDRVNFSNRRLFEALDRGRTVELTFLEGEVFKGKIIWISKYELGFSVKGGAEMAALRHGLARLSEED
jgi:hypothetical protein